jgi:toxin ParE1/3/4
VRQVRFSGRSIAQLRAVARYLLQQTSDDRAGERLVRGMETRILHLAELPGHIGRPRPELGSGVRSLPHLSYVVIFRYGENNIDVLQVVHSRQDVGRPEG